MKLLTSAQLLKTMLNIGSKMVKEFMFKLPSCFLSLICGVKNGGISHELTNFNYKLFIMKHVPRISLPHVFVIDESSLVGKTELLNVVPMVGTLKSHVLKTFIHEDKAFVRNNYDIKC